MTANVDWIVENREAMRRLHRQIPLSWWRRMTSVFWRPFFNHRYSKEFDRLYPEGLSHEMRRRIHDLGDPYGEYAADDPRKYGIYDQGTGGYVASPGQRPFRKEQRFSALDNPDAGKWIFESWPNLDRRGFRRVVDFCHPSDEYDSDDPRRYGIYGMGTFGYEPTQKDLEFDGRLFQFWDSPDGPPRIVDTTVLTDEQYRRLFDLGDPYADYEEDDRRRYGRYGCPRTLHRSKREQEIFMWTVPELPKVR